MTIDEQKLARVEQLRIPLDDPTAPLDWKDWYHYVLLDPDTQIRALVNLTAIARPGTGEIQTSFLVTIPADFLDSDCRPPTPFASFGTTFSQEWNPSQISPEPVHWQGQGMELQVNGTQTRLEVQDRRSQLFIELAATATATPLLVTENSPFGSGFIGWGLVPGLQVRGNLSVGGRSFPIHPNWFCYHDRNFGRFRWGEDIGWEWFVAFGTCEDGTSITLVLDRRTNKDHSQGGFPYIFIYVNHQLRKVFLGATLQINWDWSEQPVIPPRLPGIMALLFSDRLLQTPRTLQIIAADEQDQLLIEINFESVVELIVPDNQQRQYTFIEELTGSAAVTLKLGEKTWLATGLVYGEYVI